VQLGLLGLDNLLQVFRRGLVVQAASKGRIGQDEGVFLSVVSALVDQGVVTARTMRSPLRIGFPARLASRWMPGLLPEQRA